MWPSWVRIEWPHIKRTWHTLRLMIMYDFLLCRVGRRIGVCTGSPRWRWRRRRRRRRTLLRSPHLLMSRCGCGNLSRRCGQSSQVKLLLIAFWKCKRKGGNLQVLIAKGDFFDWLSNMYQCERKVWKSIYNAYQNWARVRFDVWWVSFCMGDLGVNKFSFLHYFMRSF